MRSDRMVRAREREAKKCAEAGLYSRIIDFVYHSTLGLRVIKKKKKRRLRQPLYLRRFSFTEPQG